MLGKDSSSKGRGHGTKLQELKRCLDKALKRRLDFGWPCVEPGVELHAVDPFQLGIFYDDAGITSLFP